MTGLNGPNERQFRINRGYDRLYRTPESRPSNRASEELLDATTRKRIAELTAWLDGQALVEGCEALLRSRQRLADPGE